MKHLWLVQPGIRHIVAVGSTLQNFPPPQENHWYLSLHVYGYRYDGLLDARTDYLAFDSYRRKVGRQEVQLFNYALIEFAP